MSKLIQLLLVTAFLTTLLIADKVEFTKQEKKWIKNNPTISYVGDPNWLPFEAFENGKYIGVVADLIKYIEDTTLLKFNVIKTSSWKESVEIMDSKKVMLMSQSKDFNKQTTQLFSEVYFKNPIVIVMKNQHPYISSLYSINKQRIAVVSSSAFLKKIKEKHLMTEFIEVKNINEGLASISSGQSDAFIHTLAQTSYAIASLQLNDLRIVGRTEFDTKLGFGISKEYPILKDIMDKVIKNLSPNIMNNILSKWIQQKYVEKVDYTFIYILFGSFLIISGMGLFFHFKVRKEINSKLKIQEKILEQQSKMAAMGEMLDSVAHQWKQPLNALTMYLDMVVDDYKEGLVDAAYVKDTQEEMLSQITHMTTTLTEFRNFFRPNTEVVNFNLLAAVKSVLLLTKDEFLKNSISIEVNIDENIELKGNKNEFKHLILNIINNAKDAFNAENTKKRNILLSATKTTSSLVLEIQDSAGGIPLNIIEHIFESNFTTKSKNGGTGIGLYMSSQIVKKMGGSLSVKNLGAGACFYIKFDSLK